MDESVRTAECQPDRVHSVPRREEIPGGWEGLAAGIVFQACEDYRAALRLRRRDPDSKPADRAIRGAERFFASRWFRTLSDLDGPGLLRQLKEESEQ